MLAIKFYMKALHSDPKSTSAVDAKVRIIKRTHASDIPKGYNHSAQGCEARATLGDQLPITPSYPLKSSLVSSSTKSWKTGSEFMLYAAKHNSGMSGMNTEESGTCSEQPCLAARFTYSRQKRYWRVFPLVRAETSLASRDQRLCLGVSPAARP